MSYGDRLKKITGLQKVLQYRFNNYSLLDEALTHRSYTNEKIVSLKNNERLEFLGDSVLDLIVSVYMIRVYTNHSEGTLSKIRAAVVNEQCFADLARNISLGECLLLGRGEELSGGRDKNSLLANAFEAIAGAICIDSDFEMASRVFLPLLLPDIQRISETSRFRDYKSELQEYTQNKMNCIPSYRVVKESGPEHEKVFYVSVIVQKDKKGVGSGKSKKEAEQAAAREALEILDS